MILQATAVLAPAILRESLCHRCRSHTHPANPLAKGGTFKTRLASTIASRPGVTANWDRGPTQVVAPTPVAGTASPVAH